MRDRSWRRTKAEAIAKKRYQRAYFKTQQPGRFRKNHYGCGCAMCKPWKHGLDKPLKPSERRRSAQLK